MMMIKILVDFFFFLPLLFETFDFETILNWDLAGFSYKYMIDVVYL